MISDSEVLVFLNLTQTPDVSTVSFMRTIDGEMKHDHVSVHMKTPFIEKTVNHVEKAVNLRHNFGTNFSFGKNDDVSFILPSSSADMKEEEDATIRA